MKSRFIIANEVEEFDGQNGDSLEILQRPDFNIEKDIPNVSINLKEYYKKYRMRIKSTAKFNP